jgi:hypothetical protein
MYKITVFSLAVFVLISCSGEPEINPEAENSDSVLTEDSLAEDQGVDIQINDDVIRKLLPQYPKSVVFKIDYLDFFAAEAGIEKELAEDNDNQYIIKGDFNNDGHIEFAVSGLVDTVPIDNQYQGFVIIFRLESDSAMEIEYFESFTKYLDTPDMTIRNLALKLTPEGIMVIFANNTDFGGYIIWEQDGYIFLGFN